MAAPTESYEFICSMCNRAEDEGEEDEIWWIECSSTRCSREYHLSCVGLTTKTIPKRYNPWYCPFCVHQKNELRRSNRPTTSRYRENSDKQPNHVNDMSELRDTSKKLEQIDISGQEATLSLPPVTTERKNLISILFLALISFLLGYLFVSCLDF